MKDCKCNLACPIQSTVVSQPICCYGCNKSRRHYLTNTNKEYWDDELGFWSEEGCKLPRDQMPKECREYDCRDYVWCVKIKWNGTKWIYANAYELKQGWEMVMIPESQLARFNQIKERLTCASI